MRYVVFALALTFPMHAVQIVQLGDAFFRRDAAVLDRFRTELAAPVAGESAPDAARRLYYAGLADWLLSMSVGGDSARMVEASRRADAAAQKAIELDPSLARAYELRSRAMYTLMNQGALPPQEAMRVMVETHTAAKKIAPDDPVVMMQDGIALFYSPRGDKARGRSELKKAIEQLAALAPNDADAALWLPIAWTWYGNTFLGEGDIELARDAFDQALAVRPDYAFVRTAMLPMTAVAEGGEVPRFSAHGWTAMTTDPTDDGRSKSMPELRAVAWRADRDRVWFRLDLANDVDRDRFGVNLALDLDGDQKTGLGWWAGNTAFKYDRLVTVWVRRGGDGKYRGSVGTADARDIADGVMITSAPDTVRFGFGESNRTLYVGVLRSAFGTAKNVGVVATVGTNVDWNDAAPNSGSAILSVRRR